MACPPHWQSQALALLLLGCAAPVAEPVRPGVHLPAGTPQQLLAAAASALGGERALAAAGSLFAEQRGSYFAVEQARSPAAPVAEAGRVFRWRFDAERGRLIREAEQHFPGGIRFWYRAAVTPEGGWQVDVQRWRNGTDLTTIGAAEALVTRLSWERFFPHLLIRQAQAAAASLEAAGEGRLRYRDSAGAVIEIVLDPATRRPARAAQIVDGRAQGELAYSDYRRRHGVMLPMRVQLFQSGRLQEDVRLGDTRIARPGDGDFAPPAGFAAAPRPGEPSLRELAPGVLFFENMPADYHSLALDMGDHLVLVEAPLSPDYAARQQALLERARPGKRVRAVLVTHHHGDHGGGLGFWAEAGATIVVPAGARVAVERQLAARGFTGRASVEEISGSRSFGSGSARADAYAFATTHAASHLVVHLPGAGILFQGDLFYVPARGPVPAAFPVVAELRRQIEALRLDVRTIAGVHGRIASVEELHESLRRARR